MSQPYLVLCGPAPPNPPAGWQDATRIHLRLGREPGSVRLRVERLSAALSDRLSPTAADLLEIAAFVYAADTLASRQTGAGFEYGQRRRRHFRFEIPVRRPETWEAVDPILSRTLGFLSDDDYEFSFRRWDDPPPVQNYLFGSEPVEESERLEEVVLFSGGLDSLAGAAREVVGSRRKVLLVSQWASPTILRRQRGLVEELSQLTTPARRPSHLTVNVQRKGMRQEESIQRARTFLFASVAAVAALAVGRDRVWFFENGVVSINLPVSAQVIGGRATRSTHPMTLAGFGELFSAVLGQSMLVENPFAELTKRQVVDVLRVAGCAALCRQAVSCSYTRAMRTERPHCGRCSQCIDRRVAVLAAGLEESHDPLDGYVKDVFVAGRENEDRALAEGFAMRALRSQRVSDVAEFAETFGETIRAAAEGGIRVEDVYRLYRQHAEDWVRAMEVIIGREGPRLARREVPPSSLLMMAIGLTPDEEIDRDSDSGAAAPPPPRILLPTLELDEEAFELRLGEGRCRLGNTLQFYVIFELHANLGRYVTVDRLANEAWGDCDTPLHCVQSMISTLRKKLSEAEGMGRVRIEATEGHYRLVVLQPS